MKYIKDRKKINTAKKMGYKVLEVWNFDDNVADMCLQFINDNV
jgi:G:T-mismatch repair DNA endonuclease (very short patch repair protein)